MSTRVSPATAALRERILSHLERGIATTPELQIVAGDTYTVVYKQLVTMVELGLIQGSRVRLGPGIKRKWRLHPDVANARTATSVCLSPQHGRVPRTR